MKPENTNLRITITRVELMRLLAAQIRKKTAAFEKLKKKYPRELMLYQKKLVGEMGERFDALRDATTYEQVFRAAHKSCDYKLLNGIPQPPKLNVCRENELLQQLKFEKREKLSLRASDQVWILCGMDNCRITQ